MEEHERYFFDLNGYIVIENVLSKNEIKQINEAIDNNTESVVITDESIPPNSKKLEGDIKREEIKGMLAWSQPWCQPFRNLINHPKIVPYLNELLGEAYLLDHLYGIMMSKGAQGLELHGGGGEDTDFAATHFFYHYNNGRMRNGLTVTTFLLADEGPGDGGFMCVPGSHKSNIPMPKDVAELTKDLGIVKEITAKAGSAIIFTESLSHGTLPWRATHQRRAILYKYAPGTMKMAQNYLSEGVDELLEEFTPAQRERMNPIPTKWG